MAKNPGRKKEKMEVLELSIVSFDRSFRFVVFVVVAQGVGDSTTSGNLIGNLIPSPILIWNKHDPEYSSSPTCSTIMRF